MDFTQLGDREAWVALERLLQVTLQDTGRFSDASDRWLIFAGRPARCVPQPGYKLVEAD
jgi:hypothetical protein